MLKLLAVCFTLAVLSQDTVHGKSSGLQDLWKRFQERRGAAHGLSSGSNDLIKRTPFDFNGRTLDAKISPQNAKVGDTVTVKCIYTGPENPVLTILKESEGKDIEIGHNQFLNPDFEQIGRYKANVKGYWENNKKEVFLTLQISDVQIEDSGLLGCEGPTGQANPKYVRALSLLRVTG